jgi:calcium-dependent protein kinase
MKKLKNNIRDYSVSVQTTVTESSDLIYHQKTADRHLHVPPKSTGQHSSTSANTPDRETRGGSASPPGNQASESSSFELPPIQRRSEASLARSPDIVRRIVHEDVKRVYKLTKVIGSGNFGTVRLASPWSSPHKVYAVKSIPREKVDPEISMLEQELLILMEVDHPNIIKFYETYKDDRYYRIVMEYCNGGELFEHLKARGRFSECESASVIQQLLSAIKHLHDKNIAHRDLKPENIIFVNQGREKRIQIKLIDFGLSKHLTSDLAKMDTKLGTPYYVSPEVLEGNYDKRCDLWSIGVMTYMLLSGNPPF